MLLLWGNQYYKASLLTRSISIVIPAYNEQVRLPDTLRHIVKYLCKSGWAFREIIVVDDGSTDGTAAAAEEFARCHPNVRVLRNPGNRGKGYSVRRGMLEATGEWCLFSDADLSAPIEELEKLWDAVQSGKDKIAIGSRAIDRSLIGVHQPGYRETLGRFFNGVMRVATGLPISDTQCGFKAFQREKCKIIFEQQRIERFGFDPELLYLARHHGLRAIEIPVRWAHSPGTKVSMLRDSVQMFADVFLIRWNALAGRYPKHR